MSRRQSLSRLAVAALVAGACLVLAAPAFAQNGATPPPAGAAFLDDEAAGGTVVDPPAPLPPATTSCGAQNCITLELSPEALDAVERGGDLADFAAGITYAYEGANPPAIYFVAARYENGRLEQYANTQWVRPESAGAGLTIEGVGEAIATAANRFARPPAALTPASEAAAVWMTPVSMQGFVVETPRTYLIGDAASAPIDRMSVDPALAERTEQGPVLLVAFVAANVAQRTPEQTLGVGAVIPLADGE